MVVVVVVSDFRSRVNYFDVPRTHVFSVGITQRVLQINAGVAVRSSLQ